MNDREHGNRIIKQIEAAAGFRVAQGHQSR
jgi:hypothetical protein